MCESVSGKGPNDYVFTRDEEQDGKVSGPGLLIRARIGMLFASRLGSGAGFRPSKRTARNTRYVGLNLHDFRRSAIRNMTRRGVGNKTAMTISGHKTFAVFQRYNIVDETDLIQASEAIEKG